MSDNLVDLQLRASAHTHVTHRLQKRSEQGVGGIKQPPRTLFDGINEAACEALGVRSIRHRSALHELGSRHLLSPGVVDAVLFAMERNWNEARRRKIFTSSLENWRWCRPQPQIAQRNTSPEVRLERSIAAACVRAGRQDWSNQVPVASGVVGTAADRRRAIDLVHQIGSGTFEFIELKIASDTPLYAAIEIIGYGCAWLLAREGLVTSPENALLSARELELVVLAPSDYYAPFRLGALEAALDTGLRQLGEARDVRLGFRFERLPDELTQSCLPGGDALLGLMDRREPL